LAVAPASTRVTVPFQGFGWSKPRLETHGKKWTERKGQAILAESDFKRPLYQWGDELFANAVRI
jgi:hypothetical protein